MFSTDQFVDSCLSALKDSDPISAISELVGRAVRDPASLDAACPVPMAPDDDGLLYRSEELLIALAVFPRCFSTGIHDHAVPAVIGVWSGYEDNHLYRKGEKGLAVVGVTRVEAGEVLTLEHDAIHEVRTPLTLWSGALHVYLGDIMLRSRHQWASPTSEEVPFDGEAMERHWEAVALETGLVLGSSPPER